MIIERYFFLLKLYVVIPHLNCLDETVQIRGHIQSNFNGSNILGTMKISSRQG